MYIVVIGDASGYDVNKKMIYTEYFYKKSRYYQLHKSIL